MPHVLRAISGPQAGAVYVLGARTTLGRASDCDIQILHEGASRHHAKVVVESGERMVLIDLSSDNGTFVEGERISRHLLTPGEAFRIMRTRFTYEVLEEAVVTSAVFRRKVTSSDSLRQTIRRRSPPGAAPTRGSAGLVGTERGRPFSRPQAAAPARSGARPGAAGAPARAAGPEVVGGVDTRAGTREVPVELEQQLAGFESVRKAETLGVSNRRPGPMPVSSSVRSGPPATRRWMPETQPEHVAADGAMPPNGPRRASVTSSVRRPTRGDTLAIGTGAPESLPTSGGSARAGDDEPDSIAYGLHSETGHGRRERVSHSLATADRTGRGAATPRPSGRMAPPRPVTVEPEPSLAATSAPVSAGPPGGGSTRLDDPRRPTPGSMRPRSTLAGVRSVEGEGSTPAAPARGASEGAAPGLPPSPMLSVRRPTPDGPLPARSRRRDAAYPPRRGPPSSPGGSSSPAVPSALGGSSSPAVPSAPGGSSAPVVPSAPGGSSAPAAPLPAEPEPEPELEPELEPESAKSRGTAEYGHLAHPEAEASASGEDAELDAMATIPTVRRPTLGLGTSTAPPGSAVPTEEIPAAPGGGRNAWPQEPGHEVEHAEGLERTVPRVMPPAERDEPTKPTTGTRAAATRTRTLDGGEPRAAEDGTVAVHELVATPKHQAVLAYEDTLRYEREEQAARGQAGRDRPADNVPESVYARVSSEELVAALEELLPDDEKGPAPADAVRSGGGAAVSVRVGTGDEAVSVGIGGLGDNAPEVSRPRVSSAELVAALEELLPQGDDGLPVEAGAQSRPDAATHPLGSDGVPTFDHVLDAASMDTNWPGSPDMPEEERVELVELHTQEVMEQADREYRQREGLSTLIDILEYRELRLRSLRGKVLASEQAQRYRQLEERLQRTVPDPDDMDTMRRYHRFVCSIPALLTRQERGPISTVSVAIEDISAGGAKVTFGEYTLEQGDIVWLSIDLTDADRSRILPQQARSVVFQSRVVWTRPHDAQLGLIFAGAPRYDYDVTVDIEG